MQKKINEEKGITLITLVITIIVLSILVGVSISSFTGDRSIISQSKETQKETEKQALIEEIHNEILLKQVKASNSQVTIEDFSQIISNYGTISDSDDLLNGTLTTEQGFEIPIKELWPDESVGDSTATFILAGQKATATANRYIDPISKKIARIPEGFTVSNKEGENEIDSGLVVIAPDGSEYVWIPVDGRYTGSSEDNTAVKNNSKVLLGRYMFNTTNGIIDTTLSQSSPEGQLKKTSTTSIYYTEGLKNSTTNNTHAKDIEEFISSVEKNGGYYIGRYEASKGANNKALSIVSKGTTTSSANEVQTNYLWNFITQPQAVVACQNLYSGINSDLVNSYAWDTALLFIQKNSKNPDYSIDESGNVKTGILKNTGETGDVVCNIYDMSGNCLEWTTESGTEPNQNCTDRGGGYNLFDSYASVRYGVKVTGSYNDIAFRSILYFDPNESVNAPSMNKPLVTEILPGQTATSKTRNYVDFDSKKVAKIPEGFTVSNKQGETGIDTGLVVIGPDGSEYVWIPVDGIYDEAPEGDKAKVSTENKVLLGRYNFNTTTGVASKYTGNFIEEDKNDTANLKKYGNTIANDINEFINSVKENGGYYIGRYEASKGANGRALSIVSRGKTTSGASSVLENYLWNFITQPEAAKACQNLYTGIKSDLVNSYAWDTALLFIQKNSGNSDYSIDASGNVETRDLKNTGETEDNVCNIYDISGNCREWSTETSDWVELPCVNKGSDIYRAGIYASGRYCERNTVFTNDLGFRSILYL